MKFWGVVAAIAVLLFLDYRKSRGVERYSFMDMPMVEALGCLCVIVALTICEAVLGIFMLFLSRKRLSLC